MAVKADELESGLIDTVCRGLRERLPDGQRDAAGAFVRQYYHWLPPADLEGRSADDLLGAALSHWRLAETRPAQRANLRVFNPEPQRDGFASPYTVIEIVSDNMPFIVDSVTMELARLGHTIQLAIHPVMWMRRDADGRLQEVLEPGAEEAGALAESVLRAEVTRERDPQRLEELERSLHRVLDEVRAVVDDWSSMRSRARELAAELKGEAAPLEADEIQEAAAFLEWVADDHFTFLGYREYDLSGDETESRLEAVPHTGLGILRGSPPRAKTLREGMAELAHRPYLLVLTKANSRATVHRPAHLDYIGVKRIGADGKVCGESRFLGLYTSSAYRTSPLDIPLLAGKVRSVLERAGFPPASHDSKALLEILETYPRDALLQIGTDDLFATTMGLLRLGERPRVRLFAWTDPHGRFVSCTVTIPRDRFNTENRERAESILLKALGGSHVDYTLQLSESVLVRVNYVVWTEQPVPRHEDLDRIEAEIGHALRGWDEELLAALVGEHGEDRGAELHRRYSDAFPPGYRSDSGADMAVSDIDQLEGLEAAGGSSIRLYRIDGDSRHALRCRLYSAQSVALSDVLPTFEHMGARVIDERPYRVRPQGGEDLWIYDFGLRTEAEDLERVRELFQEAFIGVQRNEFEDDGLGGLVLRAALTGREIVILRAVARYLRQAGIPYSDAYMERTLNGHPDVARLLVKLFLARFDPDRTQADPGDWLVRPMEMVIDGVPSLDEDRILRSFLSVVRAILRTNYFRRDSDGRPLPYLALKLDTSQLPVLPKPRPKFEIFVYAPRFEGVHLRGGPVARGGIRWSDRPEDFRSEILGLMKAQMVKNALIVPVGAKGGFVLKQAQGGSPESRREEAIACYRMFLRGLLELTDNIVEGEVRRPERVVRYDADDSYLVVAADKGTAAFSDIANSISDEYGYWLGDAFASGGSRGYDHKQMGITARGAWESVKRHFRELGTDVQRTDFSVVGIGDMSGDVFGNGMLLSRHIKLVAAFDHEHVFLDPSPEPESSFQERQRLFELESSTWKDYDPDLISAGGGVYERSAKSISISSEARQALAIEAEQLAPEELIQAILRAPVDLLFNGGIGTYVKASTESHAEAVDKANDPVRVNGGELRCRVVVEGGNLGFTQRGRMEYAARGGPEQKGGRINTDSIDNAAGVNCSDHEVNIKILLDSLVRRKEIDLDQRNRLLQEMTDAVAEDVLYDSYRQTQAISLALAQAEPMIDVHGRVISWLEQNAGLDRELEYLPSEDELSERKSAHRGLLAPEISVLMAHCKIHVFSQLLKSDLPDDDSLAADLEHYFPHPLERFRQRMGSHRLRREIIATQVANQLVDRAGTTFVFRLSEETGAPAPLLVRGFAVAREVFGLRAFWVAVERLDYEVDAVVQLEMLIEGRRLAERTTRALVRGNPARIDIAGSVERFAPGVRLLDEKLETLLEAGDLETYRERSEELAGAGVPRELARRVAAMPYQPAALDVVTVASDGRHDLQTAAAAYFRLASTLELNWLRDRIIQLPRDSRWQGLARTALREELLGAHRELTREVLDAAEGTTDTEEAIDCWAEQHAAGIERLVQTLAEIRASRIYDTTTLAVALRELRALIRGQSEFTGA